MSIVGGGPPRLTANLNGLRRPSAQMDRLGPWAVATNGLSDGIDPSGSRRNILPNRVDIDCELPSVALSPTAT